MHKLRYIILIIQFLSIFTGSLKKGVGLSSEFGLTQLKLLNIFWYYNWGSNTDILSDLDFVPMIFSKNSVDKKLPTKYSYILGFNEPDNDSQANMSTSSAIDLWPKIVEKADSMKPNQVQIGSPAMAGTAIDKESWLPTFMNLKPRVDFVTIHWYKGPNAAKFISDVQDIIKLYNLPVWITEFAPQTSSSSRDQPQKYSQTEVNKFIETVLNWMESEPMVHRYAWHNSKVSNSTSSLYNDDGSL